MYLRLISFSSSYFFARRRKACSGTGEYHRPAPVLHSCRRNVLTCSGEAAFTAADSKIPQFIEPLHGIYITSGTANSKEW